MCSSDLNAAIDTALFKIGGCFYESPFDYIDPKNKNFFTQDGKNLSEAGFKELINRATAGNKISLNLIPAIIDRAKKEAGKIIPTVDGKIESFQYAGKEGRKNKAVKYPNGEIKIGGSVSWRNNNPGNIKRGKNLGAIGQARDRKSTRLNSSH